MICKKDVIIWFKELESYKRIDTMCTLLSMCLPFELRFLGTCLEELGRRDSQELRGIELRVNNPQDLAIDMIACQKGEPTDMKIRRKMALYLALIRACNRTCTTSAEIFRTLDVWGERDFENMTDMDTLQELLLVYIMAANHPVFTFEQHQRCIEIFERIKSNKLVCDSDQMSASQPSSQGQAQVLSSIPMVQMEDMLTSPLSTVSTSGQLQHELRQAMPPPPSHQDMHTLHTMHLSGQHQIISCQAPLQVISPGSLPINFPQHQITVEAIQHMNMSNIIPVESNAILAHQNPSWPPRPFPPQQVNPQMEQPPQSSSPLLSQQSSPSNSRTTSPSRSSSTSLMQTGLQHQQQPQIRNVQQRLGGSSLKNVRRPSAETTPPPTAQMINEISLPPPQNMKLLDDIVVNNDGNQLQTLIRNGFTRGTHHARLKAGSFLPSQQQSQVPQHYQPGNYTTGLTYSMQNLNLALGDGGTSTVQIMDGGLVGMNSNKSTGSDSGSPIGSSGEISPPETPTMMLNATSSGGHRISSEQQPKHHLQPNIYKQMNVGRLNGGRGEKVGVSSAPAKIYAQSTTLGNASQQVQPQFSEIILAPGGNAGAGSAANILQTTSLGSNNNSLGDVTSSSGSSSSSNNTISSSGGTIGNVVTSNAVILQTHQQQSGSTQQPPPQYNASYSFHAAQHLTTTTRPPPPLLAHNPTGIAPQPLPSPFRYPLPPNGELMYPPAYHPASIPFLAASGPTLRTGSTASGVIPANAVAATATTQLQQLQPTQPGTPLLAVSPFNTISTSVDPIAPKPISCYNCGSQTHTGRDCQESSMDDVTRSAYKLDYSVSAASTSVTNAATTSTVAPANIGTDNTTTDNIHVSATTPASAITLPPTTTATVSNVK